jgi:uncharacterized membrane protein
MQHRFDAFAPYVATAAAAIVYSLLALRRVRELRAGAFDAGLVDNVLYKTSAGLGTVSGLTGEAFSVVSRPLYLVLGMPLYWLNADLGYPGLLVLQAVSVAMVGLATWLIAETTGVGRTQQYAALFFVLAGPAAYWAIITELHTTGLSMGLLAMTIAGAYRRWRVSYYWILPVLASMARIEVAITVVVAGLLLLGVSRAHAYVTLIGGLSVTGVMIASMLVAPDQGSSVALQLDYLGIETVAELPLAALRQPLAVLRQLADPLFVFSILVWFVMVGTVLPFRASRWFLVALPMLTVAAIGSPTFADYWYQHYWNMILVGGAVALALSLAIWSLSDRFAVVFLVVVLCAAWIVGGPVNGSAHFKIIYPDATPAQSRAATVAATEPGALSTTRFLVLPGAQRSWVYEFPNPFVCRTNQYATFSLAGPAPDVVITELGWERDVSPDDLVQLRRTLLEEYQVADTIGSYTVRRLVPGASPTLVAECEVVPAD